MIAESACRARGDQGAVHGRAWWHGVGVRAPRCEGVCTCFAGDPDQALGLGVEGLQIVVADRPVRHAGTLQGPEMTQEGEVLLTKARHLAVRVDSSATNGRREVVDVADEAVFTLSRAYPKRPRFEPWIRTEEVPAQVLDLVVGELGEQLRWPLEVDQVVLPSLEDEHRPSSCGQDVSCSRSTGARTDDDGIEVATHGSLTSSSG